MVMELHRATFMALKYSYVRSAGVRVSDKIAAAWVQRP